MKNIKMRPYRLLADHMKIYDFMIEIYEKDWRNGVPAPFLEYALSSEWMDLSYIHGSRIWEENGRIVAFCFTESPATDIYFSLRPGYEELSDEMVSYASEFMPDMDKKQRLVIFKGQDAIEKAAKINGYKEARGYNEMIYEFNQPLEYSLPAGFRFVDPERLDAAKCMKCCYKGFNHEVEEGPWNGESEGFYRLANAPHATIQHAVAVENEEGEYVCWAGMWWTPQNSLAYMEPLCTIPEYRNRGLAAAALSEHYRRMKPLGATHMTGGANPFYAKIGFKPMIGWRYWKRDK